MTDSDINKYTIEFMSTNWIITVACVIALIFMVLYVGHKLPASKKETYAKFLAALMIGFFIINHSLLFFLGKWEISKELPVHLCSISGLICCFIMFIPKNKRQFLFEFLFYCGIIGGIQAIFTPLLDDYGGYNFFYIQFFFKHAMIIAFPIYLRNNLGMKLTKFSWLKTYFALNVLMILLIQLNNILGSNQIGLGNEILDPEDAFKMTVTEIDDSLLINWEIEKNYYLYQNSIKVTHKNRSVEFELIGDPVVHKDEFLGETVIYRNSLDLEILDQLEQNLMNYEVVFQGCAEKRFCYTPIKVKLSSL